MSGRAHHRVVAVLVTGVEGVQGMCGRSRDGGEGTEQGVAVAVGVAADERGEVEVVAGVEPDPRRQPAPEG